MTEPTKMTKDLHLKLVAAWWDGLLECNFSTGWGPAANVPGSFSDPDSYRIRPKPTLRPWKPEEVPVGAEICNRFNPRGRCLIVSCGDGGVQFIDTEIRTGAFEALLKDCLHSLDGGKTWKPCGVEESQ